MALISGVSYYPAGLFNKKSKLVSKCGSNKHRDLLSSELLTEIYCTRIYFAPFQTFSVTQRRRRPPPGNPPAWRPWGRFRTKTRTTFPWPHPCTRMPPLRRRPRENGAINRSTSKSSITATPRVKAGLSPGEEANQATPTLPRLPLPKVFTQLQQIRRILGWAS